jgi:hypothetical protein
MRPFTNAKRYLGKEVLIEVDLRQMGLDWQWVVESKE